MSIKGTYFNITKIPRERPLIDVPISFPDLDLASLKLDLLEIKKKLKKGLPAQVVIKRKAPVNKPQGTVEQYTDHKRDRSSDKSQRSGKTSKSNDGNGGSSTKDRYEKLPPTEDDDHLLKLLGDDDDKPRQTDDDRDRDRERERDRDRDRERDEDDRDYRESTKEKDRDSDRDRDRSRERERDDEHERDRDDDKAHHEEEMVIPEEIFAQVQEEEDPILKEKQEREELLWDLKMIKKKYPTHDVPEFTEHDDVGTIRLARERTLKDISLDVNVNQYKKYMTAAFLGIELFCVGYLGIQDMKGYFAAQNASMATYDALLIEIGEKSGGGWGSSWPVEVRLVVAIVFNAAMFWVGKLVEKNGGGAMASIFKMFAPQGTPLATPASASPTSSANLSATQSEPVKKMRGPSVKF